MLKILWKRREIAPEEQFLLLSTIFCYMMLDFCLKTRIRFSLRDMRVFEITEVEIRRVDCIYFHSMISKTTGTSQNTKTHLYLPKGTIYPPNVCGEFDMKSLFDFN